MYMSVRVCRGKALLTLYSVTTTDMVYSRESG